MTFIIKPEEVARQNEDKAARYYADGNVYFEVLHDGMNRWKFVDRLKDTMVRFEADTLEIAVKRSDLTIRNRYDIGVREIS